MRAIALVLVATVAGAAAAAAAGQGSYDSCTSSRGDITFRAADGTRLAGHVFGRGRIGIVLAHQRDGNMCQWIPYARRLAGLGYRVLVFDFRNVGASQTRDYPANNRPGGDVAGAVRRLRALGARNVFLVGASLGGSAVLQAAVNVTPPVSGVVSVSGAADLSGAVESVPRLKVPVSYIAARGDRDFAADARRLFAATQEKAKELHLLDDSRHGVALVGDNAQARRLVESFLKSH